MRMGHSLWRPQMAAAERGGDAGSSWTRVLIIGVFFFAHGICYCCLSICELNQSVCVMYKAEHTFSIQGECKSAFLFKTHELAKNKKIKNSSIPAILYIISNNSGSSGVSVGVAKSTESYTGPQWERHTSYNPNSTKVYLWVSARILIYISNQPLSTTCDSTHSAPQPLKSK